MKLAIGLRFAPFRAAALCTCGDLHAVSDVRTKLLACSYRAILVAVAGAFRYNEALGIGFAGRTSRICR
jgi:hypothetical protein